jgi:hypothetical protein
LTSKNKKGPKPNNINMEVDVDAMICSTTKTKGLEPSNINMEVGVDATT